MIRHGTPWTYSRYRCRCEPCRTAKRVSRAGGPPDRSIDEIAVERACRGDRGVTLNRAEMAAALTWLDAHGYSLKEIGARLGVSDRTVCRWRMNHTELPHSRPGEDA